MQSENTIEHASNQFSVRNGGKAFSSGYDYIYSRSYAEDVTSVTSGASQGPHSFNLVFVCLFVCVTPGAIRI